MTRHFARGRRLAVAVIESLRFSRLGARGYDCGNEREIYEILTMAKTLDSTMRRRATSC